MPTGVTCVVCRNEKAKCDLIGQGADRTSFACSICGRYDVGGSALAGKLDPEANYLSVLQRAVLSHRIREANDRGSNPPLITTYELDDVISNGRLPTPAQQALNLIRLLGDRISETGRSVPQLPEYGHASIGSMNRDFALKLARQLWERGLLSATDAATMDEPHDIIELDLTLDGWERYEAEQRGLIPSRVGFIALKFGDPVLDPFLKDVIKPAVSTLGYTLEDLRDAARAGVIDNVMRARIRDAAFVLVDLTHANRGAYWEAGYAEGLGKPVLYLCERSIFEQEGTHFDTNHCTTVFWQPDKPAEFQEELVATLRRSLGLFST